MNSCSAIWSDSASDRVQGNSTVGLQFHLVLALSLLQEFFQRYNTGSAWKAQHQITNLLTKKNQSILQIHQSQEVYA